MKIGKLKESLKIYDDTRYERLTRHVLFDTSDNEYNNTHA